MDWLYNLPVLLLFIGVMYHAFFEEVGKRMFWSLLFSKILISIFSTWYFYFFLEGGDPVWTVELAKQLGENGFLVWLKKGFEIVVSGGFEPIEGAPLSNLRTAFFSWGLSPLVFITGGSPWLISLICSLLNLFLFFLAFKLLRRRFAIPGLALGIAILLPSILFWSSGIYKETFTSGLFVLLIALLLSSWPRYSPHRILILTSILVLIYFLRPFQFMAVLIAILIGGFVFSVFGNSSKGLGRILLPITAFLVVFGIMVYHPVYSTENIWAYLYDAHQGVAGNTGYSFPISLGEEPGFFEAISSGLRAMWLTLFGVWPIWIPKISYFFFCLEGLLLLFLIFQTRNKLGKLGSGELAFLIAIVSYCVFLAMGLGLSTPNFGTLARYKLAFVPLLYPYLIFLWKGHGAVN